MTSRAALLAPLLLAGCIAVADHDETLLPAAQHGWRAAAGYAKATRPVEYAGDGYRIAVSASALGYTSKIGAFGIPLAALPGHASDDVTIGITFASDATPLTVDPAQLAFLEPCGPGVQHDAEGRAVFHIAPMPDIVHGGRPSLLPPFPHTLAPGEIVSVLVHLKADASQILQCTLDLHAAVAAPVPYLPLARPPTRGR